MYTPVRQSALAQWKFAVLRMVLEFLMNFIVAFNPSFDAWNIDVSSPVWQVVRWTVWRSPIMRIYGYTTYVTVMYGMMVAVLLSVVCLAWLTLAMRKQEQSKWLRTSATFLHVVYDVIFVMCYVSFFDYFVFMSDCDFGAPDKPHLYFSGVNCLRMPHLLHMLAGLASAALFLAVTALLVVASSDLNPVSQGYLASPAAYTRLRILMTKAAYIICADCLDAFPRVQASTRGHGGMALGVFGMLACVCFIFYWNLRTMPFYWRPVNAIWSGLWAGILVPCAIVATLQWNGKHTEEHRNEMTRMVLYLVFPAIAVGTGITALYGWWAMRPAQKFKDVAPGTKLSKVHKFKNEEEVERLARVMRVFDSDGLADLDAAALGEAIIKAGMQAFPNNPHLFILNFRAVLRVHKEVLLLQAELWNLCMRPALKVAQVDSAMDALESASGRAHQVYKRVLERYPTNGKLLRCYGKFLEDVKHDQTAAARAYGEANRNGGSAGGGLLALDLTGGLTGGEAGAEHGGRPEFLTSMSLEDDAIIVADAEGTIMMVSQAVQRVFGWSKAELEGVNLAVLMPQPFSQRHPSYMSRYVGGGEPHILDSVREVVALHKDRYVFPVSLCVTKLSGVGADSVFLGLLRPLPPNCNEMRAWLAPNGVFLCADQQFASAVGLAEGELMSTREGVVGHTLSSLCAVPVDADELLERARAAKEEELAAGMVRGSLKLRHRYREPVDLECLVRPAGEAAGRVGRGMFS
ncbi:hypothetical protein GPECTOR_109g202 [Gonium pectorale]|uniref:PAS domain-containing protein n=1 Tax=Gonium pectorale TaxID=33097 RepID=A0A150FZE3_GONPE|nr:hypothetical protein GPECTOR_109g202 [Gonium pectorale]|eukprot:KXZ42959.1 hypothetical protein GPECTOR_109g202 [Gonium pectorale]